MTNYWFYRLKEVTDSECAYNGVENIEQDVFVAVNREAAKQHLKEMFPGLPFRKPKNAEAGTRYLYLIESDEYWYNRMYGEVTVDCCWCSKTVTIIGEQNVPRNRHGSFCTKDCRDASVEKDRQELISKGDHVAIVPKEGILVGYVYRITNKRTMKCYVGQTVHAPLFRWWQHLKIDQKFEQTDVSELVFEVLEVIHYDPNSDSQFENAKDKLNKREAYYIRLFDAVEEGYNEVQPKENEITLFNFETA
ncbi:hypothetical protein ABD91_21300 [Lysinibacillus sphaericus]|uniref:GIY-YIG nuclease family protein n=1 Tax=Lysinibacillus sphaericus TaxID=1421 RepID=UPI0018CCA20B|nr:GIY-YIG nuclease family protein [Lysinibacillus sphaericus]MBG9693276.1 hypothetical protein [Lysinibacillus sphaericus]